MSDLSFADLGLAQDLLRAVADTGYTVPTPIQAQAIPQVLQGGDLLAAAQTGTGKTAGFTLPLLQLLMDKPSRQAGKPRALVLTPRVNWRPRWKSRCANTANTCRSNPW
jgi:ATP-dependent RNA helicase RhlE